MRHPDFDVHKLIDYLQGTLNTIGGAFEVMCDDKFNILYPNMTEDDLTKDDLETIDMELFQCEDCGWWYETSFMGMQDRICQDCCDEDE